MKLGFTTHVCCISNFARHCHYISGVHCTHGFNRTGFLICSYLVEKMDWGIDAAVHTFALTRPPGIYKGGYLRELFKIYDDEDDAPPAPILPDWCNGK